ncbi:MAG: hypothetical protein LC130_22690 [Bryobacterales bacterium]|nr:hypothetical protein [Bryobacterales bacterium]MEB2362455.1 hypothetical protein [Bryobacterales bacterium]
MPPNDNLVSLRHLSCPAPGVSSAAAEPVIVNLRPILPASSLSLAPPSVPQAPKRRRFPVTVSKKVAFGITGLTLIALGLSAAVSRCQLGAVFLRSGQVDGRGTFSNYWSRLSSHAQQRAAIRLDEKFAAGLSSWADEKRWELTSGIHTPGSQPLSPVALYRPSMHLCDYELEFLAAIDSGGAGWVFRAQDLSNYYAIRLLPSEWKPISKATIVRYTILDGKQTDVVARSIPGGIRTDRSCRIRLRAAGAGFTLFIQDRIVDSWTDARFERGGMGFLIPVKEKFLLYWMKIRHQDDWTGRICAALAANPTAMKGEH